MEKPIITTAVSLLLLAGGSAAFGATNDGTIALQSQTMVATGQAHGGHESVEALKAEIAGLQTKLNSTETGRAYLLVRLQEALDESAAAQTTNSDLQAQNTDLLKSVRFMTDSRDYLLDELDSTNSMHDESAMAMASESEKQQIELQRALKGREFLSAQSKRNREKLMADRKDNSRLSLSLERALRGRAYLRERVDALESTAVQSNAENEKHAMLLEGALRDRDRYRSTAKDLENEIQQLADVSFTQINSAIAERDAANMMLSSTDWADGLSAELSESFASLEGTEVTSHSDNSVAIKVGNTGLFGLGGTNLSGTGKDLLGQIGNAIADRKDSNIKIVGHTDNIPTGSGSRFANNEELSLARAASALNYMTSIGVPAERLSVSGVGDLYPIASNDTEDGQIANRRVEIVLTQMK